MNTFARRFAGWFGLIVILTSSSCSILPPNESPDVYILPRTPAANTAPPLPWQLRVDTPEATGMLAGSGIVVMPEPGKITIYKGAQWNDPAPVLLRERLVDAFLATHRLPAVTSEADSLSADFVLSGDLRAFQSEYRNGSPVVVVRFDAQLRRGGSRAVLAARSFEVTATPSGVSEPQVVQAFGQACDQLSAQVVEWTLMQGEQTSKQPGPGKSKADTRHPSATIARMSGSPWSQRPPQPCTKTTRGPSFGPHDRTRSPPAIATSDAAASSAWRGPAALRSGVNHTKAAQRPARAGAALENRRRPSAAAPRDISRIWSFIPP